MDWIWSIIVFCIGIILFCCCICMVFVGYFGATCGANAMKVCCVIIIYVMTLPLAMAQVQVHSESYQPCVYYNTQFNSIQCDEEGLYTKFSFNITTSLTNVNETIYELPWTAVSADLIGRSKVLNWTNSCQDHSQCNIIRNNTKIRIRVLPTMIAYPLRAFGFAPAYGYFFNTYNQSSSYFNDSFSALNVTANCTGYTSQFTNPQCLTTPLFNISIPPLLPNGQLCGSSYDSLAQSAKPFRVLNGLDFCDGGVCQTCAASNITQALLAVSVPFGPKCRMFRIVSSPVFVFGVEIGVRNDNFARNYSVFLTSFDGSTVVASKPAKYTRGITSRVSLVDASVPLTIGPTISGWIVMCGDSNDVATFEPYFLGGKNPLQGVVGGVPTSNGLNASVSWYYVSNDQFKTDYGRGCDMNGNAGGMGPNLYGGNNKLSASCASVNASTNIASGYCVPGTTYSRVNTPCQVASMLNDYSDNVIAATANGSSVPPTPINLFSDWNPTNPNYHIFRNGNTLMLARAPTGRTNYPNVTLGATLDVSEMLAAYSDEIPNGIVALSQTTCAFNAYSKIGVLNIVVCNIGTTSGSFVVTITSLGNTPGFNTSLIVLNATLPATQTVTISSIIGHQCHALPNIYTFTLNNQSQFESMFTWPHFIGNISYTITDPSGTVQLGTTINPVISCDGYSGTMGYLPPYSVQQTVFSCPSFQDALAWQDGCIPASILFYLFCVIVPLGIITICIIECCKSHHKKQKVQQVEQQEAQRPPPPAMAGVSRSFGYRSSNSLRNRGVVIVK